MTRGVPILSLPTPIIPAELFMRLPAALGVLSLVALIASQPGLAANAPTPSVAPASGALLAHKALYTLTLDSATGKDVIAARGTMGYEVTDACDGWAVRQRLRMTITNGEGQDIEMASDYATWESKDGLKFRYHMRQTTDTAVTSQTDGEAFVQKGGGSGEAHYTSPHDAVSPLPAGTLFPMAHTAALSPRRARRNIFCRCRCSTAPTNPGLRTALSSCWTGSCRWRRSGRR